MSSFKSPGTARRFFCRQRIFSLDPRRPSVNIENMKKLLTLALASVALISCDATVPFGIIYSNTACPVSAAGGSATRTGQSHAVSYLQLVAIGDCSIEKAKANGGITTISSVDVKRENILGIVTRYVTIVRGN